MVHMLHLSFPELCKRWITFTDEHCEMYLKILCTCIVGCTCKVYPYMLHNYTLSHTSHTNTIHIYTHIRECTLIYTCILTYLCIHAHMNAHSHTRINTYAHTNAHTCVHAQTHRHTHTHM